MNHPKLRRWTLGARYIIFSPFPLFVSVYVYASVCDFVCIALFSPLVLGFCPSVFFFLLKKFFFSFFLIIIFFLITLFYFILLHFILFYFILFLSFFFFSLYSEPCGWKALGAPARRHGCASEVAEPTSGHWSTRDLPAPRNIKWRKSPRDLHLNTKTQLHSTTSKLHCWAPYSKQLARQEHSPTH